MSATAVAAPGTGGRAPVAVERLVGHGAAHRERDDALPAPGRDLLLLANVVRTAWPPAPLSDPTLLKPLLVTALLVVTSMPIFAAGRAARVGRAGRAADLAHGGARARGCISRPAGLLVREQLHAFRPQAGAYGSIYYTLIGVHYAHVVVAALLGVWALARSSLFTPERHLTLRVTALYWHFVNVIALVVFLTLYVSPRA